MREEQELSSTERRWSSVFPAEPVSAQPCRDALCGRWGCSLISLNYLLFSARRQMSSYFFAYLLVLWKERKSEADLIRFPHSQGPTKVRAVWVSHVCAAERTVVLRRAGALCALGAALLVPILPAFMQQPTHPMVLHHVQPEAILRRNLQRHLCPIWGK